MNMSRILKYGICVIFSGFTIFSSCCENKDSESVSYSANVSAISFEADTEKVPDIVFMKKAVYNSK